MSAGIPEAISNLRQQKQQELVEEEEENQQCKEPSESLPSSLPIPTLALYAKFYLIPSVNFEKDKERYWMVPS